MRLPAWNRREFLLGGQALAIATALNRTYAHALPQQVASDEEFWTKVREAFIRDPKIINLNNGGVAPAPSVVLNAEIEAIRYSNFSPSYRMWRELEPKIEDVRKKVASMWDADPGCIAITRNASESLENAQLGIELAPGDEVLTTSQDYPRMITTWEQRARRDRIVLRQLDYHPPVASPADLVSLFEKAISPRTRVLHFSQVVFMTGQIFPVKELCQLARSRGLISIVDGAHAFAHVPFKFPDFDCDYYGASLHKWLSAPVGTGLLYVRRDRIEKTWPLMAAPPSMDRDIRKFEEIGTHPAALHNGISEALDFHQQLGPDRKFARLRFLKQRWAERLSRIPGCTLLTKLDANQSGAFSTVAFAGVDCGKLGDVLLGKYKILTTPIIGPAMNGAPGFNGLRICPNVYTSLAEIDTFCEAVEESIPGLRAATKS
ncbi:MAG TPA: aminotransferase class V-fold PLP-dependent enzyme [Terriglobales bacterium]|nr:aminotransferase class V-fold PLP-dependent enzyme [Terriglobales bacterium]